MNRRILQVCILLVALLGFSFGATAQVNAGSSSTNGNTPGTITTTVNNDLLVGVVEDEAATSATITAGTTSVALTSRVCSTADGGQVCLEDGGQATAASGTTAPWTFNNTDRNLAAITAVKK